MSKAAQEIFRAIKNAGFVWTTGVGKSASVADLLARYLRNVGVPSAFLCPTDYWHGGRGGVKESHLLIVVSASGKTDEIVLVVEDSACQVVHVGKEQMDDCDMHWQTTIGKPKCAVDWDPVNSTYAVFELAIEYAKYAGVSRHEADSYHPAGATNGSL